MADTDLVAYKYALIREENGKPIMFESYLVTKEPLKLTFEHCGHTWNTVLLSERRVDDA